MAKRNRIAILINKLESGDAPTRRKAALRLGEIRDSSSVAPLMHALSDSDRHVRGDAAKSLGAIGDPAAAGALCAIIAADKSVGVVRKAVRSLGRLSNPCAIPALLGLISRHWKDFDDECRHAIQSIGIAGVPSLCSFSDDENLGTYALAAVIDLHRKRAMFRSKDHSQTALPGVIYAVLCAENVTTVQRFICLDAICLDRSFPARIGSIRFGTGPDVPSICAKVARYTDDAVARHHAAQLIDMLSLGRASHATGTRIGNQLLRAFDGINRTTNLEVSYGPMCARIFDGTNPDSATDALEAASPSASTASLRPNAIQPGFVRYRYPNFKIT